MKFNLRQIAALMMSAYVLFLLAYLVLGDKLLTTVIL